MIKHGMWQIGGDTDLDPSIFTSRSQHIRIEWVELYIQYFPFVPFKLRLIWIDTSGLKKINERNDETLKSSSKL